jgi:hypothetical protein
MAEFLELKSKSAILGYDHVVLFLTRGGGGIVMPEAPNMNPQFRTPIWDPDLGPRFGTPIWDPDFGPRFWTPNMDPQYGPPIWTPIWTPILDPNFEPSI